MSDTESKEQKNIIIKFILLASQILKPYKNLAP
jgi:hypothetical protein